MVAGSRIIQLLFASCAAATFAPRQISETSVYLHNLVERQPHQTVDTIKQNADGSVPLFAYEQCHLTSAEVKIAQALLSKQFGSSNGSHYWNLFSFASLNVTGTDTKKANHTLAGPDSCKVFPGDSTWPSQADWTALNVVVDGALLKPVPQAHVCYTNGTGSIDAAACKTISDNWTGQYWQNSQNDPIEMLSPMYQGLTCQPPSQFNTTVGAFNNGGLCTQGGYPVYVVNVTNVAQIQLAVNYARNTGIRLVIKNTGHDFSGKSGGAGSLSVWTHHLKEVAFIESYKDSNYSGPALKAGVGIQGFELYQAANKFGVVAQGGECPTVGAMGGWIQGGGHSPVSSLWGMGADNALGFEVVTADGQVVTANRNQNADLFWALRGGGGSTYGIVTSVIVRVHKDIPVTSASWSFSTSANVSADSFSAGLKSWYSFFPRGADNHIYAYFTIFNAGGTITFSMAPFFAANKTLSQAQAILKPWLDDMQSLGVPVEPKWQSFDGFYNAYNASFPVEGVNTQGVITASRLFPRENFVNGTTLFDQTYETIWGDLNAGRAIIGYNMAPSAAAGGYQNTSVAQAWASSIGYMITGIATNMSMPADHLIEQRLNFTNGPMKKWRDLTPGSGAYLNEADRIEPNFQYSFWGTKYPSLLALKNRYDPFNLFYATTAVGSEFFEVRSIDGYSDENGRLCTKASPTLYYAEG